MSAFIRSAFTVMMTKAAFSTTSTTESAIVGGARKHKYPRVVIPTAITTLRGSRKRLIQHGVKALLPTAGLRHPENYADPTSVNLASLPGSERSWRPPALSKRKAAVLRKEAIRNGTYGKFDTETGLGWDPQWDVQLATATMGGLGRYMAIRVPKKASRMRTREMRAQKIEAAMVGMDERMEEVQAAKHRNKPPVTFESKYKELLKAKK